MQKKLEHTLHIFGGGIFVDVAVKIAKQSHWKVIIRTGSRFLSSFTDYEQDADVDVFVGNSLDALMRQSAGIGHADVGISFSAPWVFNEKVISSFCGRLYNLHNQPLPRYRGAGGSSWNILMKDNGGGSSIHELVKSVDAGVVYAQSLYNFPDKLITPKDLDSFSERKALELLNDWLPRVLNGEPQIPLHHNNLSDSAYWPRLNAELHGWIDWSWSVDAIQSFVRAFSDPHPGAKTKVSDKVLYISEVSVINDEGKFHPFQNGLVYRIIDGQIFIAHETGTLILERFTLDEDGASVRLGDRLVTPSAILEGASSTRVQYRPDGSLIKL